MHNLGNVLTHCLQVANRALSMVEMVNAMLCLFFHLSTHSWHKAGRRNYPMSAPFSRSYCDHTCMTNERKQGSETGSWLREQLSLPCVPVCSALLRAPRPTRLYRGCSLFFFHPFILFFFHFEKHELHTPACARSCARSWGSAERPFTHWPRCMCIYNGDTC